EGCEFFKQEVSQVYFLPTLSQQYSLSSTKCLQSPRHCLAKFCRGSRNCKPDHALHDTEQVLVSVLDFPGEEPLPFLQTLPFGYVDRHAYQACNISVVVSERGLGGKPIGRASILGSQLFLYLASGQSG